MIVIPPCILNQAFPIVSFFFSCSLQLVDLLTVDCCLDGSIIFVTGTNFLKRESNASEMTWYEITQNKKIKKKIEMIVAVVHSTYKRRPEPFPVKVNKTIHPQYWFCLHLISPMV